MGMTHVSARTWQGETLHLGASHPRAVEAARKLAQWLVRRHLLQEAEAVLLFALASAQEAEASGEHVSEHDQSMLQRLESAGLKSGLGPFGSLRSLGMHEISMK